MSTDVFDLRFEKILDRGLQKAATTANHASASGTSNDGPPAVEVVGADSAVALAFFLSQMQKTEWLESPRVVIVADDKAAEALAAQIRFFDPKVRVAVLPGFDVSPYSGLYPRAGAISDRIRWCYQAQKPDFGQVFIAPVEALLQRAISPALLRSRALTFRTGQDLPQELSREWLKLGYQSTPIVEDEGTFAIRGGIVDVFSPAHERPVRIELFGDTIESLRFFDPETQRSEATIASFTLLPPREILFDDETRMRAAQRYRDNCAGRDVAIDERDSIQQSLSQGHLFPGIDFLIGDFYEEFATPLDHFKPASATFWWINPIDISREADTLIETFQREYRETKEHALHPRPEDLFCTLDQLPRIAAAREVQFSKVAIDDQPQSDEAAPARVSAKITQLTFPPASSVAPQENVRAVLAKVAAWRAEGYRIVVASGSQAQQQRLAAAFDSADLDVRAVGLTEHDYELRAWVEAQDADRALVHLVPRALSESLRFNDEMLIFLRDEDFFGKKQRRREYKSTGTLAERTHSLSFGDLNPGDSVVHVLHGIGTYEGLKVMPIGGIDAEFITLSYKDGDKLYLPIYRIGQIQKYSGPVGQSMIDKLGGTQWAKVKSRVRGHLREIANDLLQLYAKRSQIHRPAFPNDGESFATFEAAFPYDETDDQLRAIGDIVKDMTSDKPMDRLVCGDVGFGKTEVAMRAAFKAIEGKKQIAVLAPTTVLSFQHLETFQKRFGDWPVVIRALNRFVPPAETKKTLAEIREGKVDIVVGTHRLLSKDIVFKDLGLMIIDEEQRFGVTHKERMKQMKTHVDTLTLSATPIPRTLNMSLVGMRDLSIINTPPHDRLPTRTFVTRFDKETIAKAITSEIQRGGQIFFLHNRVQSIYSIADEIRELVPEARIRVGHGQMEEHELEQVMVAFYHHQIDVLVCTTIIESGIDNPRANTMFIDNAHQLGLSQLYQLRGRVGRSKERAYCYLLIPANRRLEKDAQERLRVIQENTELGSGIRIAHHDLELRGAGNLLGEDQSGHIDSVGYEMYLELLEEAIAEAKGEPITAHVEPDINVRIPALIPDTYIPDLRIRLSYYKALSQITSTDDIDRIEDELRDQFGKIPDPVLNLMGLMLIRYHCRELGIRDLSSTGKSISLAFTETTPLPPTRVVELAQKNPAKYSLTPDMRLSVKIDAQVWPNIYDEMLFLKRVVEPDFIIPRAATAPGAGPAKPVTVTKPGAAKSATPSRGRN